MIQPCSRIESLSLSPFLPTPLSSTNSHKRDLPPIPFFCPFLLYASHGYMHFVERGGEGERERERERGGEK